MEWRGRGRRPSSNSSSNYLMHRVAEPCGKSIPISLMKTLMFIEVAKKVQERDRLCKHPALKNALEKVILELGPAMAAGSADPGGDCHGHGEARDDGGGTKVAWSLYWSGYEAAALLGYPGHALRQDRDERAGIAWCSGEDQDDVGRQGPARLHLGGRGVGYQLWKTMSEEAGMFTNCEGTCIIGAMGKCYHASHISHISQATLAELVVSQQAGGAGGGACSVQEQAPFGPSAERAMLRSWAWGSTIMWPSRQTRRRRLTRRTPTMEDQKAGQLPGRRLR